MRTTLSLDDDLAESLNNLARETRKPFKSVVNDAIRRGLGGAAPQDEFQVQAHAGHLLPGIDDRGFNELAWDSDSPVPVSSVSPDSGR